MYLCGFLYCLMSEMIFCCRACPSVSLYLLFHIKILCLWNICCLMLQLTINLLPVNHEPFFPRSYYVVREFSESATVGQLVTTGTTVMFALF